MMVTGLRGKARRNESENEGGDQNVIVKSTLSLRRLVPFRRARKNQHSNRTALSTVCSFEEHDQGTAQHADPAVTLTTRSGETEALYCPQQELRYLYDQGLEHHAAGKHSEATESLTQALVLSDGSDLEPRILWTLVAAQQDENEAEAGSYLTVLKPHISKLKDEWIEQEASLGMMSLLIEHREWSTSLKMASYVHPGDAVLARIHFETAANLTTEKAMPHLEKALELCQDEEEEEEDQNESLKQSILHAMVHAHAAEAEWDEALSVQESYMESLQNSDDRAQAHHDAAELYLAQGQYEQALSSLKEGLELVDDKNPVKTKLLQAEAHVVYKLGDTDQALELYKSVLSRVKHCPSDAAKIYYTMGRICCKTGQYQDALSYFKAELKITKAVLGKYHYENSRIYHDIARIHDDALGDYESALKYYNKALKVEQRCLKKSSQKQEISAQILETQHCMGRLYYKKGDFGKAFDVSFHDDISV